jgi:GNAT superfamily N-acetyltransferase
MRPEYKLLSRAPQTSGELSIFDGFYDLYDSIFTLPDEKESREGFLKVFSLNDDAELQEKYGPYREDVAVIIFNGEIVAGCNYLIRARRPEEKREDWGGVDALVQLNYVFVADGERGKGYHRLLTEKMEEQAALFFANVHGFNNDFVPVICTFAEQNNPLRMTLEEYEADNAAAGTDQCDRLLAFQRGSYRRLDFPYIQPALEEGGDPCDYLMLVVKKPEGTQITNALMCSYLSTFIGVSIKKGGPVENDPHYRKMMKTLEGIKTVPVCDDRETLPVLKKKIEALLRSGVDRTSIIGDLLSSPAASPSFQAPTRGIK